MTLELATLWCYSKGQCFCLENRYGRLVPCYNTLFSLNCNVFYMSILSFYFYSKSALVDLDQHADVNMLLGQCYRKATFVNLK